MTKYPPIQVVDEDDNPIRGASMEEIHREGLRHRIVIVILKDSDGRILLQKRGPTMATNPNVWDASAAGHVDEGEDYLTAAKRELHEELGIDNLALTEVDYYKTEASYDWRQLNRYKKVYTAVIPSDTEFKLHPEEITEVKWFTPKELAKFISEKPDEIVGGFVKVLGRLDENYEH